MDTALFKSFFPQLVAGPIVKAHDFYPQIGPKRWREVPWEKAFQALVIGYFLKMVIADNLTELTFFITYPYYMNMSTLTLRRCCLGTPCRSSPTSRGTHSIAIGLARLFGYELIAELQFSVHFAIARGVLAALAHLAFHLAARLSVHPARGESEGAVRNYFNLLIVMTLGGLWHGASWSYAIWGIFHGLGLAVERFCQGGRRAPRREQSASSARMLAVFAFVTLGWLLFKLPKIEHVAGFWRAAATNRRDAG